MAVLFLRMKNFCNGEGTEPLQAFCSNNGLVGRTDLIGKTYDDGSTAFRNGERCQRPHMALDDVALYRGKAVTLHCIFQRDRRVMKSVQPPGITVFVPVIQIKIVKKCTADQLGIRRADMKAAVQIEAESNDTDHMIVGRDMTVLDALLHQSGLSGPMQSVQKMFNFRDFLNG